MYKKGVRPNAGRQARRTAGAQRTLAAVACTPWLGTGAGTGLRLDAPPASPPQRPAGPRHHPAGARASLDTHPTHRCRVARDTASGASACRHLPASHHSPRATRPPRAARPAPAPTPLPPAARRPPPGTDRGAGLSEAREGRHPDAGPLPPTRTGPPLPGGCVPCPSRPACQAAWHTLHGAGSGGGGQPSALWGASPHQRSASPHRVVPHVLARAPPRWRRAFWLWEVPRPFFLPHPWCPTPAFSCCRKPERRRSVGCRQSAARRC
jgi:hypothetical protein